MDAFVWLYGAGYIICFVVFCVSISRRRYTDFSDGLLAIMWSAVWPVLVMACFAMGLTWLAKKIWKDQPHD